MKIFNIFASTLAFMLLCSLSPSNLNDELGEAPATAATIAPTDDTSTTGPTPTIVKHPVPYRDAGADWPKTAKEGNVRFWKTYWGTKEDILATFSLGRGNLYEAFNLSNKEPISFKTRSLDVFAAAARFTLVPALYAAISFPITYYFTDENGQSTDTMNAYQHEGPSYSLTDKMRDDGNRLFGWVNRL
ncbi:MAG: hypothetical protein NT128_03395 [Proteobacteria bacterium]|nr:hypothetical protein [Pseudomonadota bacterium]